MVESMITRNRKRHLRTRGQAMMMVALAIIPMSAIVGLTVDLGWMHYVSSSAQTAADAAALAAIAKFQSNVIGTSFTCGVNGVVCRDTPTACPSNLTTSTNPIETACLYAKQNGFSVDNARQNVTVQANVTASPPSAPGLNSAGYWVTVRVTQTIPQLFSAIQGNAMGMVSARATAALTPSKDCIYVLDPSADGALSLNGTTSLTSACGIYDNSSSPSAISTTGTSTLLASEYDVVGGVSTHAPLLPAPNLGVVPAADPFANLAAPPVPAGCDNNNFQANAPSALTNIDVYPGTYCGGIAIKKGHAIFHPGTYFLKGGGLTTQDSNSSAEGTGLLFYNTYDATHSYGPISLAANSAVSLKAATSGTYAGMLFFQDRTVTGMPLESLQGGPTTVFEGAIYMPKSSLSFAGNPTMLMSHYTIVVVRQLQMAGNSYFNNDYSVLTGGSPIKMVALVE